MKPDLLYFLGRGSTWQDNELRFSLRSAAQFLPHRRVFIVGQCPAWLRGVIHIPASDRYEVKVRNTLAKLALAVEHPKLQEDFVLMNDDFFLLRPVPLPVAAYTLGTMAHQLSRGVPGAPEYRILFEQGLAMLRRAGIAEPLNFESHHPLPMRKSLVRDMLQRFGGAGSAYPFRSVYGNWADLDAVYLPRDVKQRHAFELPSGDHLSVDDSCAKDALFRAWCSNRWPEPSPYER